MNHEKLLIIDFGSQVTQLIARRIREFNVYCEIHPYHLVTDNFLKNFAPKAIIFSGGPASVTLDHFPRPPKSVYSANVPILGICYGQQVMIQDLGGQVSNNQIVGDITSEFGRALLKPVSTLNLLDGWFTESEEEVWMSHGDHVTKLGVGFDVFATSRNAPFAVVANTKKNFFGVQFHPEVHHTPNGKKLIDNFLALSGFSRNWSMNVFCQNIIRTIQKQIGDKNVICGLSGGVDSSVVAVLLHKAIGNQLTCIFVDHGLLRQNEANDVIDMFRNHYNIPLLHADSSKRFLKSLKGIIDPEEKRKTIGRIFVDVFQDYAQKIEGVEFLAQGTLYPDVIESVSFSGGPSVTIKSHHNVGGLPKKMSLRLIEPLRDLFKDEVRQVGRELGLPEQLIRRHPFPGPGLAIRCPGEVTPGKLEILRKADAIFIDQIHKHGLYNEIWQAFVVILPVRTVGVMGDNRTYDYACVLRAVTSVDGMTADYFPFSTDFLRETSTRLINEVRGINRVTYDITSKPPGTIEWE
ncbi:MAG: glutamine-hydrolyzing GMP synthase [Aestuariivita sp.]|nr:glutamine-hydrolyzing GMP synthase [Aestuariivita sp.]